MREASRAPRWSRFLRALHWLTVLLLAVQLPLSLFVMGPGMATLQWLPVHLSLGVAVSAIIVVRLFWRTIEGSPTREGGTATRVVGGLVQAALYGLLLATAVTGWIAYRPIPLMPPPQLMWAVPMPRFPNIAWLPAWPYPWVHRTLVWVFLGVAGAHVAAVVLHAGKRDGIFRSMWFDGKPPGGISPKQR
jgi:cytochrome b561